MMAGFDALDSVFGPPWPEAFFAWMRQERDKGREEKLESGGWRDGVFHAEVLLDGRLFFFTYRPEDHVEVRSAEDLT